MKNHTNSTVITDDQKSTLQQGAVILAVELNGSTAQRTIPDSQGYFEGDVLRNSNVTKSAIRWLPSDLLAFRNRINQKVQRLLTEYGISYYGGATLIPAADLPHIEDELNKMSTEFDTEVLALTSNLDREVERHKVENPDIAHLVERFRESASKFASRFQFRQMPATNLDFVNGNASEGVASDMTQQLIDEVSKEAAGLLKKTWLTAEKATAKTLEPVFKLKRKLNNLSFLDDSIEPIAEAFDNALHQFPSSYPVTGQPVEDMKRFIAQAANPDTLREFGKPASDEQEDEVQPASVDVEQPMAAEPETDVVAPTQAPTEQSKAKKEPEPAQAPAEQSQAVQRQAKADPVPKTVTKPKPASSTDDADGGFGWGNF